MIKWIIIFTLFWIDRLRLLIVWNIKILIWRFETLCFHLIVIFYKSSAGIYLKYLVISFIWINKIISYDLLRSNFWKKAIWFFSLLCNTIVLVLRAFHWFQIKFRHTIWSHSHLFIHHIFLLQTQIFLDFREFWFLINSFTFLGFQILLFIIYLWNTRSKKLLSLCLWILGCHDLDCFHHQVFVYSHGSINCKIFFFYPKKIFSIEIFFLIKHQIIIILFSAKFLKKLFPSLSKQPSFDICL